MDMNTQATAQPAPQGNPLPQAPASAAATQVRYAGFWMRFVAMLLDSLILVAVSTVLLFFLPIDPLSGADLGLSYLIFFVYYTALHGSSWQATIGKKVLGMRVMRSNGDRISYLRALARTFGYIPSTLILLIGYIMAAFTDQKKSLHDIICDTRVVYDTRKQQA